MDSLGRALFLAVLVVTPPLVAVAVESPGGSDVASWAGDSQPQATSEIGFAPLSVMHSGVVYSPAAPAFDPTASDASKIADLPAWASSDFTPGLHQRKSGAEAPGVLGFGAMPEPAAWALILIGTAMICGALRGLIVANRRLARLRSHEEID